MGRSIAIVEDDDAIRENYAAILRRQGYDVTTYRARDSALDAFRLRLPDLAILDIGLGEEPEGGFELCRELRAMSATVPIIFLTARDSDLDAVSGLRLGADDYLTKVISMPHLLARVAALLRRVEALKTPSAAAAVLVRDRLILDIDRMTATWEGQGVPLTVTEFWIVHGLVRFPGHVKQRAQLMDDANMVVDENTITSHIKRIRRKFLQLDTEFNCIEAVYGAGYRWMNEAST